MNNRTDAVINEIEKVIIGKREVVERVLMAILSEGHILLDDVPGVGKTTLAVTCSVVMGVQYQRMQFTPDVVPSDIVGFSVYNKATGGFDYKPGVVMTNLLLADEINRTSRSGDRRWCHPSASEAFCGYRHTEPGGIGRYAAASTGAVRPFYDSFADGISGL